MAKTTAIAPRRLNVVSKSKYEALEKRMHAVGKRGKQLVTKRENGLIGIGAGVGLGLLAKSGKKLPTIGNIDPNLLWGGALFLLGPELMKGKNGERIGAIGTGMLTVAGFQIPQRGLRVAGAGAGADDNSDDDDDDD